MALTTTFQTVTNFGDEPTPWQYLHLPEHGPFLSNHHRHESALDNANIFSSLPETTSPTLTSQRPMPEFVQPQDLHPQDTDASSSSPRSPVSVPRWSSSIDSASSSASASIDRHQRLRRLSLVGVDLHDHSYRPRNTPAKRKKTYTGRITPRSDKHARELELNRKAATKCRNRQKAFIDQLQERCRREEEKMHLQTSLVAALHDEIAALRNEVLRQSFCECRFLSRPSLSTLQ